HRAGFRILGGTEGREEFRICVEGLLPPLIVLSLVAFVKRLCNGLAGIRHRRTYAALPISPFACLPRRVWRFSRPQRGSARSPRGRPPDVPGVRRVAGRRLRPRDSVLGSGGPVAPSVGTGASDRRVGNRFRPRWGVG